MNLTTSHYTTLGIAETASAADIKTAYRRLVFQWHPDRNPGNIDAETTFKSVHAAYVVLGDPLRRVAYDRDLAVERQRQNAAAQRAAERTTAQARSTTPFPRPEWTPPTSSVPSQPTQSGGWVAAAALLFFAAAAGAAAASSRPSSPGAVGRSPGRRSVRWDATANRYRDSSGRFVAV